MNSRVALIFLVVFLVGCGPDKKIMKAFRFGKYQSVITYYKGILEKDPNNSKANFYVGESYRLSNRIKEAEPYYAKAKGREVNRDSVVLYYAYSLKANGKYEEAKKQLEDLDLNVEDEDFKALVQREIDGIDYIEELARKKSYYKIKNLEAVNTPLSEYSPAYLNGEFYFTASRGDNRTYLATGTPFSKLYKATTSGANVDANTITPLPEKINTPNVNDGSVTFSPDGRIMIFAKGNSGKKKGNPDVDLYMSRYRNGNWEEASQININQPNSWESTPAFGPDGRTLYFSSNRKGGFGGLDIYTARMDSRGRFSRVRNMGPDINTSGNEFFPYVSESNKLFLASDGHPGYGMLDLFEVKRANGKNVVENLGQPVNSTGDDFGIFLFKSDRGFFTSNREGGLGDDDIYTFVNEDPNLKVVNYYLEGVTMTPRKDSTLEILASTKVTILDEGGEVMQDFVTGNDGKFFFRIYENENYTIVGETDGYLVKRQGFTTNGKSIPVESLKDLVTNITLDTIMVLDRLEKNKIFVLNNIYFDFNMSDIRTDAAKELDKLLDLLTDNPEIKIELSSHTDSIASNSYNIQLSQRRAESTVAYLISKGIATDRLVAVGYGEEKPIARNTNRDGSDNPDGRQRNRRTEFKILEIGIVQKKDFDAFDEDKYFKNEN